MKLYFTFFICLFVLAGAFDDRDARQDKFIKNILKKNICEKRILDMSAGDRVDKTDIQYLGTIITAKKQILKFVNTQNVAGNRKFSPHGNSVLYIYNFKNEMLGYYYLGGFDGVPSKIKGTNLIFINKQSDCNQTTSLDFRNGIIKSMFVKCAKGEKEGSFRGDFWPFTKT